MTSWDVFFACVIIFNGLSTISMIVLRYRLKIPGAGSTAINIFKWIRESRGALGSGARPR
jgi:hypothetical protein